MLQKRSRSLELSALHPSQQLQQAAASNPRPGGRRDKNYENNFNYQNVLPLFNVQETIRPTTYRPQLLNPTTINHQGADHRFSQKPTNGYVPLNPTTIDPQSLQGADHRFSQKQTNGYLPLNHLGQRSQPGFPSQRQFPPPTVQIVPSISLNDDNGLISQNQFDLGPPLNQQVYLDPAFYNQQLQYDQFRNGQPPLFFNVQEEQFPYHRPIRKESDRPPPVNDIKQKESTNSRAPNQRAQPPLPQNAKAPHPVQQPQHVASHPEGFDIPLLPQKTAVSVSTAILAEEFEHTSPDTQPQPRQTLPPSPQEFLAVPPQFVDNGFFSTDFGPSAPIVVRPPSRLRSLEPKTESQTLPATNKQPAKNTPAFSSNTPQGSFSRFVISSGSDVHESFVKY